MGSADLAGLGWSSASGGMQKEQLLFSLSPSFFQHLAVGAQLHCRKESSSLLSPIFIYFLITLDLTNSWPGHRLVHVVCAAWIPLGKARMEKGQIWSPGGCSKGAEPAGGCTKPLPPW